MVAVENTEQRHHMVVCTLCSCYPWPVLGLPPTWYKSAPYRSRAVKDPRGVLADFGITLPDSTEIRVLDSTSEVRYLVIPRRPPATGHLGEEQLAALVTRDSMIGTGLPKAPDPQAMSYLSHADLGGRSGHGRVVPEPEGELFHAAWEPRVAGADAGHGSDRRVEHRHEPQRARNAARLRRPHLLRDLVQGAAEVADRARASCGKTKSRQAARSTRRDSWQGCCTRPMSRRSWRRVRPPLAPHRRRPASQRGIGFACARPRCSTTPACPRMRRGRLGTIERVLGVHVFADAHAQGLGEQAQWLYTVVFDARELWGPDADAGLARFPSMRGNRTWSGWRESAVQALARAARRR